MDPLDVRAETPGFVECCYLNTGASGPSPRRVVEASADFERRHKLDSPCGDGMYATAREAMEDARETVASFLGATPDEIALTRSTVESVNHVAMGLEFEPGDVVVRTDLEHPAGELPWSRLRDRYGIEIRGVATENGRLDMDTLADAIADARLVCLSSVTWNYGTELPISDVVEVAHEAGALVLVDAVQSVGQTDVDVDEWGADFVAASGHKWLLGPWGSGMLYVSSDVLPQLTPERIGYFSVEKDCPYSLDTDAYRFRDSARRFELGTTAVSPYVALETAIETIEGVGLETVESRIQSLTDRLKDGLGDRLVSPRDSASGLVTFDAEHPEQLVERLDEEDIRIRWLPDPHACRASVHAFNTESDVDRLLSALDV